MKAVVLAAGEGVRLQPITLARPKHLIKLGGKPLLEHCLKALKKTGIEETVVVTHYMGDSIREYFGDGQKFGLKIDYVEQNEVAGTGNALSVVEPYLKEDFLLVYGDLLFSPEITKRVVDDHAQEKSSVTMAVVPVENPENYGIVRLENDKHVSEIVEKPPREKAPSDLANTGIYVFSMDIFDGIRQISASVRGEWEIPDAISSLIREKKLVTAVTVARHDWMDIGRPWDLLEANNRVLTCMKHKVNGNVEEGAHLIGPVTVAETAHIRSGAYIEGPSFIDEESDVGPNCYIRPSTTIGRRVRVGNACEIKNSLIMDETHVGHLSYVGDSIIGEHCNLGAGTVTANYRLDSGEVAMMVKNKFIGTGRRKLGAVLGDGVKTGIDSLLMPGIKLGNDCWVGPNVVVNRDLPSKTVIMLKQEVEQRTNL